MIETRLYSFEELINEKGWLVYTNVGVSMWPLLRQKRDIVEIRKKGLGRLKKYDVVLYKQENKYILHRILKVRQNDYVLCGDHNIRREYGITDDQILGVMTRVIRDGKSIYPTDWKYQLYVHLWCDFYQIRATILYIEILVRSVGHWLKKLFRML